MGQLREIEIVTLPGVDRERENRDLREKSVKLCRKTPPPSRHQLSKCVSMSETIAFGPDKRKEPLTVANQLDYSLCLSGFEILKEPP